MSASNPVSRATDEIKQAYLEGQTAPLNRWDALVSVITTHKWNAKSQDFLGAIDTLWPGKEGRDRQAKYECRQIAAIAKHYEKIKDEAQELADDLEFRKELNASPAQMFDRIVRVVKTDSRVPARNTLKKKLLARRGTSGESDFKKRILEIIKAEQKKDALIWDGLNELYKAAEALTPHPQPKAGS